MSLLGSRRVAVGLVAACVLARVAAAQTGGHSDVSGPVVTSSDAAAGVFVPPVGAVPRVLSFSSVAAAAAVADAISAIRAELGANNVAMLDGSPAGALGASQPRFVTVPGSVQVALLALLQGEAGSDAAAAELLAALNQPGNDEANKRAGQLVAALRGLFPGAALIDAKAYNVDVATKVEAAVTAFNKYVDASGEAFLLAPPPAFLALNAILRQLTPAPVSAPSAP